MEDEPGIVPGRRFWTMWLTPHRLWEFGKTVAGLVHSVDELGNDNRVMRARVHKLELQAAEHDAQLRLLTGFVRDSLSNRLEGKIDKLAAELLANKNKS